MEKRVTIREVAERAGLHYSSVSLALRNDPRLPEKTRERVRKLAERMGYVPDAALGALAAYRNARRKQSVHSELAYLTDRDAKDPFAGVVYRFAREQAARLGYQLVEYNISREGAGIGRMQDIWWSRGVRGVLIGPFNDPAPLAGASWDRWPVVAYGYSVPTPHFNRALLDHFENMLRHLSVLRARGYGRIGFCLLPSIELNTSGRIHAAYLLEQDQRGETDPVPILREGLTDADVIEKWIRRNRVDAVIAYHEQYDLLAGRGWRMPADIGFSLLSRKSYQEEREAKFAGFDTKAETLAANSIHFLVSLIHEQACGVLSTPRHYMISGMFHEGRTLRRIVRKSAAKP